MEVKFNIPIKNQNVIRLITDVTVANKSTGESVDRKAMWDTGATMTLINASLAYELRLQPIGVVKSISVMGLQVTKVYHVDIRIGKLFFHDLQVAEFNRLGEEDVIIGMDVIASGDITLKRLKDSIEMIYKLPPYWVDKGK